MCFLAKATATQIAPKGCALNPEYFGGLSAIASAHLQHHLCVKIFEYSNRNETTFS